MSREKRQRRAPVAGNDAANDVLLDSVEPKKSARRLADGALTSVLGYRLAMANVAMRQVFTQRIGDPLELRPVEFTVLQLLLANDDVTQSQLARTLAMSAPNVTTLLDRLGARDLVERERSENDRRAQHVRLTSAGRALARKTQQLSQTMEDEALAHLSHAERAMLVELLEKVIPQRDG
ncbi:MAG TPA: MarR family winged helix-turn-helix transcriptional regulator [Burkholderiaceae bacterium]|nr:MarR family winged helix-turn-helix transcriptional regulator [Burkholderiaceae bacterium]